MIVLDTCLFYSLFSEDDKRYKTAKTIFKKVFNRGFGQPIILEYVYNELMTLIYVRKKDLELCTKINMILAKYVRKGVFDLIHTPNEIYWKANQTFLEQDLQNQKGFLSYTDTIIGEMAEWLNATYIGTFDNQFHRFKPQIISE